MKKATNIDIAGFIKFADEVEKQKGIKFDAGKQAWFALPLEVLEPLANVFEAGKLKYGLRNCLLPFDNSSERFFNSMMRHAVASQIDPLSVDNGDGGTRCYHLAQVAFSALMRLYHAKKELEAAAIRSLSDEFESFLMRDVDKDTHYCDNGSLTRRGSTTGKKNNKKGGDNMKKASKPAKGGKVVGGKKAEKA